MKRTIFILMCFLTGFPTMAQTCTSIFFPSEQGVKFQHSSYNGAGNLEAITDATVLNVSHTTNKVIIQTALRGQIIGNNEIYNTTVDTECYGNITYTDPSQFVDPSLLNQFMLEYNGEIFKKEIEIPNNIKVGDALPDYFLEVYATVKGIEMHFSSQTYGRTVTAKQEIEALTGTYDCFVIESETHTIIDIKGFGETATTTTSKLWVAKNIGTVKLEDYANGELKHYVELTGFQN